MLRRSLLATAVSLLIVPAAMAQDYPDRTITMIVPFAAGGPTDTVARLIAEPMTAELGQQVIVENVGGAGGTLGAARVAKAEADGYTLLLHHIGQATSVALYRKLPYDPVKDFAAIGLVTDVPMTIVARHNLEPANFGELMAWAKAKKEDVTYANAGIGSASHLCGLMWQHAVKLDKSMTTIAYRGTGPAMNDLIGGQVDVMCDRTTNTTAQIEGGRVKAFAVTTAKPLSGHPVLKHYPSLQEMGLRGFNLTIWHGLYAPKGTPAPVLKTINDALVKSLKDPEFIKKQEELGALVVTDARVTPEGHKKFVSDQINQLKTVIDAAGQYAD